MKRFINKKVMVLLAVGVVAIGSFSFAYPGRMGGFYGATGSPAFSGSFGHEDGSRTWGPGYGMMGGSFGNDGSPAVRGNFGGGYGPGARGFGMMGGYAGMPCDYNGVGQGTFEAVDTDQALADYLDSTRVEIEVLDKVTYDSGLLYAVVRAEGEDQPIELIVSPVNGFVHTPRGGAAYRGRAVQDPLQLELTAEEAESLAGEALEKAGIEGTLIEGYDFATSFSFYLEEEDEITQVIHVDKRNGFVRSDARFGAIEKIEREEGDV